MDTRFQAHILRTTTAAAFALLVSAGGLVADTVWLTNGRSLEGRAVVRDDGDVELHSTMGVVRLPGHKVDRVERSQSIEDRVAARLDGLQSVSADDLYELGMEARLEGAYTLSERLLNEAVRLDPDHEASRRALGFVRTPEGWMLEHLVAHRSVAPRGSTLDAEAAERIALLRALRAQSEASRRAEFQRQQLLALEAQRRAEEQSRAEAHRALVGIDDDFVVQTVIPIWSAPYITPYGLPYRAPVQRRTSQTTGTTRPAQGAAPVPTRRSGSPDRPPRRNTLVQRHRPNG